MRVRNESVAVRLADSEPAQFIWRNRLWRVLTVQHRWVEAAAWWRTGQELSDRQIWRVTAAPGASEQVGIYELSCRGADDWQLRSVID